MMKVVFGLPPNIEDIYKKFPKVRADILKGSIIYFCYGDEIYTPIKHNIQKHIVLHESVHAKQQEDFGSVTGWWEKYLNDQSFRLDQELEAYAVEYMFTLKAAPRSIRRKALEEVIHKMSGEMYGFNLTNKELKTLLLDKTVSISKELLKDV